MDWMKQGVCCGMTTRTTRKGERWDFDLKGRLANGQSIFVRSLRALAEAVGVSTNQIVCGRQPHGTEILRIDSIPDAFQLLDGYDGYVTSQAGVVLATFHADCVPIYYYDPKQHAIGMAHAGWRGTAAGMAGIMVERMHQEFGTLSEDLQVRIGPCIAQREYEVDTPVIQACEAVTGSVGLDYIDPNHARLDLVEVNREILKGKGVRSDKIQMDSRKTDQNPTLFYSHRCEGERAGRMLAWITLEGRIGKDLQETASLKNNARKKCKTS